MLAPLPVGPIITAGVMMARSDGGTRSRGRYERRPGISMEQQAPALQGDEADPVLLLRCRCPTRSSADGPGPADHLGHRHRDRSRACSGPGGLRFDDHHVPPIASRPLRMVLGDRVRARLRVGGDPLGCTAGEPRATPTRTRPVARPHRGLGGQSPPGRRLEHDAGRTHFVGASSGVPGRPYRAHHRDPRDDVSPSRDAITTSGQAVPGARDPRVDRARRGAARRCDRRALLGDGGSDADPSALRLTRWTADAGPGCRGARQPRLRNGASRARQSPAPGRGDDVGRHARWRHPPGQGLRPGRLGWPAPLEHLVVPLVSR